MFVAYFERKKYILNKNILFAHFYVNQLNSADRNSNFVIVLLWKVRYFSKMAEIFNIKGQLISKCLFGVFTFFQKMNENKSTSSKVEFVRSFLVRSVGLKNRFEFVRTLVTISSDVFTNLFHELF